MIRSGIALATFLPSLALVGGLAAAQEPGISTTSFASEQIALSTCIRRAQDACTRRYSQCEFFGEGVYAISGSNVVAANCWQPWDGLVIGVIGGATNESNNTVLDGMISYMNDSMYFGN